MPCYMVSTVSVEFSPNHYGLLNQAVTSLGGRMMRNGKLATVILDGRTITLRDGKAEGPAEQVNKLRVAYSQAILGQAQQWAAQKGWQSQKSGDNKLTISKRR